MKPKRTWRPGPVPSRILAHATTDRVALLDGQRMWSFGGLTLRAGRVAARLGGTAGLNGARVALLAPPDNDWVAALLGIWLAGGVVVPLSPQYPAAELAWFCDDAGVELAIVGASYAPLAAALQVGRRVFEPAALSALGIAGVEREPAAARDLAAVIYTSGTTGKPKGAMLTHGGLGVQTDILATAWGMTAEDRLLHALPLHHVHGLVVSLLTTLAAGGSVRLLPRFAVDAVVAELRSATVWMGVPTMYQKLRAASESHDALAEATQRLRLATSGSAALPVATADWWASLTGAIPLERYGLTESGIILSNALDPTARHAGEVGAVLPTFEVRLQPDTDAASAAAGVGELEVRGPSLFAGYWNRPDATAAAFSSDGWFRTGDRAVVTDGGRYRLLGRTSVDVIKSGGYKISAVEIEDALRQHPSVADVAVVGVPDDLWGERVVAAVVATVPIDPVAVREWVRERLASYQVPKLIVQVDDLPRNPMGKCVKPELIAQLTGRAS